MPSGCLLMIASGTHVPWRGFIVVIALLVACGAHHNRSESNPSVAAAVRGFPTIPGATWDGDITTQEGDGQQTWIVSWTAPAAEYKVQQFFMRSLGQFGWQWSHNDSAHELKLRREDLELRGYLRFGQPEFGEAGTGVTLGIRDARPRKNGCPTALPSLPSYPGAEVRTCDLVHVLGARSLSILVATRDDAVLADRTVGRAFLSAGWTSEHGILGVLEFRHESGGHEIARVIWGPDPAGSLVTGFMISIDLPEAALSELPQ